MKKQLKFLFAFFLLLTAGVITHTVQTVHAASTDDSGVSTWNNWGTVKWGIDSDGTLWIKPQSGSTGSIGDIYGRISDSISEVIIEKNTVPWFSKADDIKSVRLEGTITGSNMNYLFAGLSNCRNIDLTNLKVDSADSLQAMFAKDANLEKITGLEKFNTSKVTNMHGMFQGCSKITDLNVSNWDTSKVTNMGAMFQGCSKLTDLNVSKWDTSKVTNMGAMFWNCSRLANLDVSKWNTSQVTVMAIMFHGCSKLTDLNVSKWDTSKVTNMSGLFSYCSSLVNLNLSKWDTSKVTDMTGMFYDCSSLASVGNVSKWDTGQVIRMNAMFAKCPSLTNLDVSNWNTSNVTNMSWMFQDCSSLTNLDVSKWNTSKVTSMSGMFRGCSKLANLDVSDWATGKVTDMSWMFQYCSSLTNLDVSKWDTSKVTDMTGMFNGCSRLANLDVSKWNTSQVTGMAIMFNGCSNLARVGDLSNWDTSKVTDMSGTFYDCSSLANLDVSKWDTSQVTYMNGMFAKCSSLANLDVSNWNTHKVTNMSWMFYDCSSFSKLDMSNWDTSKVTNSDNMFYGTTKLQSLILGSKFNINSAKTGLADDFNYRDSSLYSKWVRTSDDTIKSSNDLMTMDASARVGTWVAKKMTATVEIVDSNKKTVLESATIDNYKMIVNKWVQRDYTMGTSNVPAELDPYAPSYKMTYTVYMNPNPHVYAVYNNGTLTFIETVERPTLHTDNVSVKSTNGTTYTGIVYKADGSWYSHNSQIKTVGLTTKVKPSSTNGWFSECTNLTSVKNAQLFDMSNNTNMYGMFDSCSKLASLDVSKWDTSKVTNMSNMFMGCRSLTALDVSKWDTSKVIDMNQMFVDCEKLTNLDISKWDTSKVTDMHSMFIGCASLTNLDVSKWDTSNVTLMYDMFYGCDKLVNLNVSKWDTSKVTRMDGMFANCSNLTDLDVSKWDTSNVILMYYMFYGCNKLADLDVSNWDTSKVTDMHSMFAKCSGLTNLDVSKWNTGNVKSMRAMFQNCNKLTTLDVAKWNTSKVTNMSEMFQNCYELTTLDVSKWDTSGVTDMNQMFKYCSRLANLNVSKWDTSKVTHMYDMFNNCSSLTNLDVSKWDTSKVIDMSHMFAWCNNLTNLDVSNWNTSQVWNMDYMFAGCSSFTNLDLSNWDTSKVTDSENMFAGTTKLQSLTLGSKFNIRSIYTGLADDFNKRDSSLYSKWVRTSDDMIKSSDKLMTMNASARVGTWVAKKMTATIDIVDSNKKTVLESAGLDNYKTIVDKWAHRGYMVGTSDVPAKLDPYAPSYKMTYNVYMNPQASTYSVSTTTPKGTYMLKDGDRVGTKTINLTITMHGGAYFTFGKMLDVINQVMGQKPAGWHVESTKRTVTDGYGNSQTTPQGGYTAIFTAEFAVDQDEVTKNYGEFAPALPTDHDSYDVAAGGNVRITLPDVYKVTSLGARTAPSSTRQLGQDTVYAFYKLTAERTGNHSNLGDLIFTNFGTGHNRQLEYLATDGEEDYNHITVHMPIDWTNANDEGSYKWHESLMKFEYVNNYDNPDMAVVDTDDHMFDVTWYLHKPILFDDAKPSEQQVPYGQINVRGNNGKFDTITLKNTYAFLQNSGDYLTAKAGYGIEYPYQVMQKLYDEGANNIVDDNDETVVSTVRFPGRPLGIATTSNLYDDTLTSDINHEELRFHTSIKQLNDVPTDTSDVFASLYDRYGSLFYPIQFQTLTNITARSKELRNGFQTYADEDYYNVGDIMNGNEYYDPDHDIMNGNKYYDPDHRHCDYIKDNVKDGDYPLNINANIGDVIVNKNFKIQIYGSRMASKDRTDGEININGALSGTTSDTTSKLKDRYGISEDEAKQLKDFLKN